MQYFSTLIVVNAYIYENKCWKFPNHDTKVDRREEYLRVRVKVVKGDEGVKMGWLRVARV